MIYNNTNTQIMNSLGWFQLSGPIDCKQKCAFGTAIILLFNCRPLTSTPEFIIVLKTIEFYIVDFVPLTKKPAWISIVPKMICISSSAWDKKIVLSNRYTSGTIDCISSKANSFQIHPKVVVGRLFVERLFINGQLVKGQLVEITLHSSYIEKRYI